MNKVSIISHYDINVSNGSTARPRWQIKALERLGFNQVQLIDKFNKTKINEIENTLIHAHQFCGRLLKNCKYMSDIHGLEHIQSANLASGFSSYSWKKYVFKLKSHYYKKIEEKMFQNSVHLICSGEDIQEKVKNIQNSTVIRNAVFLDEFVPTSCSELKVALVGPFLRGTINYLGLPIIKKIIKNFPKIQFVIIGQTDEFFKNEISYSNTKFVGVVNDYINTLRECSVLFSPYPEFARYLGSKNKFLEAAACKIPIITTSSGAIDFRNDLLLIGNTDEELKKLFEYIKDENVRKELGTKLRNEIQEKFNADIEVKKLVNLYNEFMRD